MLSDRIILVCTIIIAVVYMLATTQIPSLEIGDPLGPRAFPHLLGIALLCSAGLLGWELWRDRKKSVEERGGPPDFNKHVLAVLGVVVVWTGIYYLIFERLGFILATIVFLLPLCAYFNRGKWIANVVTTILFSIGTYYLFVKLDVNLPQGILQF
jgi:putative tricarboxylic transport membrane protein